MTFPGDRVPTHFSTQEENSMETRFTRWLVVAIAAAFCVPVVAMAAGTSGERTLFITSAVENGNDTATFPVYKGTSHGQTVWYLVLDSSNGNDADAKCVNRSQKLANARGTTAVQKVSIANGVVDFPASVDFSPQRIVQAPNGFPPD